jgi:hypothetical protein
VAIIASATSNSTIEMPRSITATMPVMTATDGPVAIRPVFAECAQNVSVPAL